MTYTITQEIKRRADTLNITLKPSRNKSKKLDAYDKDGNFITSFGASGYKDYHIYRQEQGQAVADAKRKQYKARHEKDRHIKYRDGKLTAGYLADRILW
jgi:hypothetical protein